MLKELVTPINAVNSLWSGVSEATPLFLELEDKRLETLEEHPTYSNGRALYILVKHLKNNLR